jgi:hypothetical protein
MAFDRAHVHSYKNRRFIDGCHFVTVEKTCTCGAVVHDRVQRDFRLNPLQIAFARQDCKDCRELTKGIEPAGWSAHV